MNLYVLKQAPRGWFGKFIVVITSLDFHSSDHDSSLFVRTISHGHILFLLDVNNMIISNGDVSDIDDLKLKLARAFEMKDLVTNHHFLGI